MSEPVESRPWHSLTPDDALARLDAQAQGLTTREAGERLARFGPNQLAAARRRGPLAYPPAAR